MTCVPVKKGIASMLLVLISDDENNEFVEIMMMTQWRSMRSERLFYENRIIDEKCHFFRGTQLKLS